MTFARFKLFVRALLSLALIALVIQKVEWADLAAVLLRVDLRWATLGWILVPLLIGGLAWRWQIFLRQQDIALPFRTTFQLTWAGQFFNSCLPGSTGGDLVKVYQLCRLMPTRKASAAATVIADRASALLALLLLAGVAFILEPAPLRLLTARAPSIPLLLGGVIVVTLAGLLVLRAFPPRKLFARIAPMFVALRSAFAFSKELTGAFLLALAIHLLNFLVIYLFARALNLRISYTQVLLMMPVILFVVLLPITINGHGLRELLLIGYFGYLGVTAEGAVDTSIQGMALALSLLIVASDLLLALPGGLFYLLWFRSPAAKSIVPALGTWSERIP